MTSTEWLCAFVGVRSLSVETEKASSATTALPFRCLLVARLVGPRRFIL